MSKVVSLLIVALLFAACQLGRFVVYNFADITDHNIFPSRTVNNSPTTFEFQTLDKSKVPKLIINDLPLDEFLEKNKTVAFLVIRNDTLLTENYFRGYDQASSVASFSMAKSVTSILIGCAIDDGIIQSVHDPIVKYLPELSDNGLEKVTIEHLLQMTSGIKFNESYVNPFGHAASFYYGTDLRKQISKLKLKVEPGTTFHYSSGDAQLLGLVLERTLKGKSISTYLQEKLWIPLNMEYRATWSLDRKKNGLEKTFCCINARARDFAKIGRLYMNEGNWNGQQIVSKNWVQKSIARDTSNGADFYQYQWWLPRPGVDFMAKGILGQYIYVHPEKNLIIVRLGKNYGKVAWDSLFALLADDYY